MFHGTVSLDTFYAGEEILNAEQRMQIEQSTNFCLCRRVDLLNSRG